MTNPRLSMFCQDVMKVKSGYEDDDLLFGFFVLDKQSNTAEIDGDPFLFILYKNAYSKIKRFIFLVASVRLSVRLESLLVFGRF